MEKMSLALCNLLLDTNPLKTIFNTARIRIYDGVVPATADAALFGNTLLAEVAVGGGALTWEAAASGGVLSKETTDTWEDTSCNATGTATFYRLVNSADAGGAGTATTTPRIQGTVGTGGADMNLGTTALVAAAPFTLTYYTQAFVPS